MQMIAGKAKIAARTAHQLFDHRDAIFAEIYEEWVKVWWSALMKYTTMPWTEANWREQLHALAIGMAKNSPRYLCALGHHHVHQLYEAGTCGGACTS